MAVSGDEQPEPRASKANTTREQASVDRLKLLYPLVNESETPLPRSWNPNDKSNLIGLALNNLQPYYKGYGRIDKDAGSVRTTCPIPPACGLYYFEVKIVSKGRSGYIGIGVSGKTVSLNRLPGWDKHSFGYHGDDGRTFRSSGIGDSYGPTFTTGDVIGCGINFMDNSCFYTKNGLNLGTAFTNLPSEIYPTVGLRTPGEIVYTNFGKEPFVFDLEDIVCGLRSEVQGSIQRFPAFEDTTELQETLQKMITGFLVHHGYCETARTFAQSTGQNIEEELDSIKIRKTVRDLVLSGRIGQAIETTKQLYPGLLENNLDLLFLLKCRQFIEMISGAETCSHDHSSSSTTCPADTTDVSAVQSPKYDSRNGGNCPQKEEIIGDLKHEKMGSGDSSGGSFKDVQSIAKLADGESRESANGNAGQREREVLQEEVRKRHLSCAECLKNIVEQGRQLYTMRTHLQHDWDTDKSNENMLQTAFFLLAYNDPWKCPVGWQLEPSLRENVYGALNSAIMEFNHRPRRPSLEIAPAHAQELSHLMASTGSDACAFASLQDILGCFS